MRRIAVLMGLLLGATSPALAAQQSQEAMESAKAPDRVEQVMAQYQLHPAFGKLGRGLGNVVGGWLEIPLQIEEHYVAKDPLPTFCTGFVVGLFRGVVRTGVGAYETATFFLPYPENYEPVLPPLGYFTKRRNW